MSRNKTFTKPPVDPQGPWVNASYELTYALEDVTPRRDLIAKIAPDAAYDDSAYDNDGNLILDENGEPVASQHAAITFLEIGVVEINPVRLPDDLRDDPKDFHPLRKADRKRYPVIWGAAIHEAAHANYSKWVMEVNRRISDRKLTVEQKQWAGAAMLLEESRIEKNQVEDRPQDQPWLEAAAMNVAVDEYAEAAKAVREFKAEHPEADDRQLSRYTCGRAAALTLARVDGGSVIRNEKINEISKLVSAAFNSDFDKLRQIWLDAQEIADDDADGMLEVGRRWFEMTQDSGDDSQPMGVAIDVTDNPPGGSNDGGLGKKLSEAATDSEKEASGEAEEERREKRLNDQKTAAEREAEHQRNADQEAAKVFGTGAGMPNKTYNHPVIGYRQPTMSEVNLARATRKRLQAAYVPEKTATKVTSVMPPGRLSTRAMQQQAAQRSMGMVPSAEPFTYTDRRHVSTPPLKVGIIQDVSGSQSRAAAAAASGAWALAKAANEIPDAKVAMVSFGDEVSCIIKPLTKVTLVPKLEANAGTYYFLDSLDAVEGQLQLTRPGAARLVVVLTDGRFMDSDMNGKDAALRRLTSYGVKVLWMDTDGHGMYLPSRMPGLHIFDAASGNYDAIPNVICHEAVTALTK